MLWSLAKGRTAVDGVAKTPDVRSQGGASEPAEEAIDDPPRTGGGTAMTTAWHDASPRATAAVCYRLTRKSQSSTVVYEH